MALTKVSTDGVKDDAITSGKIPANAVGASELADNAVDTNAIANNAVTAGKTSGVQTTINNNADNRVITGSGTANTLNGESNLTFNGSLLTVSGEARAHNFYLSANGSPPTADASIFRPANNSLGFATGSTERVRVTNNGLTFNGDTAAANALDDYEEGTWTVGIESRAVSGSEGLYTKIGRFVVCQFALNGLNASTTGAYISGLPFTSRNTNQIGLCQIGDVRGVTYSSGFSNIYGRVNANVTNVQILQQESNGSSHTSNMTLNTNVILRGYIWYMTV